MRISSASLLVGVLAALAESCLLSLALLAALQTERKYATGKADRAAGPRHGLRTTKCLVPLPHHNAVSTVCIHNYPTTYFTALTASLLHGDTVPPCPVARCHCLTLEYDLELVSNESKPALRPSSRHQIKQQAVEELALPPRLRERAAFRRIATAIATTIATATATAVVVARHVETRHVDGGDAG